MSQKRSLTGFLVASLGFAAALAVVSPDVASAGDTVTCSKVKSVCEKHGSDKGKITQAMKDAVKEYKKANPGEKMDCKSCHTDKDNALNDKGEAEFKAKLAQYYK